MITNDDCTKCGACCAYFFDEDLWEEAGRRGVGMFIADDAVSQIPPPARLYYEDKLLATIIE